MQMLCKYGVFLFMLWGNAYAQIIRNGKGEVIALYPLMPNKMTVDRDTDGHLYYKYMKSTVEAPAMPNSTVILPPCDVLHIPGLGFDGLVGYSPIATAKKLNWNGDRLRGIRCKVFPKRSSSRRCFGTSG